MSGDGSERGSEDGGAVRDDGGGAEEVGVPAYVFLSIRFLTNAKFCK